MSDVYKARVRWLSLAEGGRSGPTPSPGTEYITVARFEDPAGDWTTNAWSVVVHLAESASDVEVSFLSSEAPRHLLRPGVEFELYEGRRKVAVVTVM